MKTETGILYSLSGATYSSISKYPIWLNCHFPYYLVFHVHRVLWGIPSSPFSTVFKTL